MGVHPSWHPVTPERLFLSHRCSCLEGTSQPSPRPACAGSVWLCQAGNSPAMCQPWLSSLRAAHLRQKWEPVQDSLCGPNLISSRHATAQCFSRAKWSQLHSSWGCGEPNPPQAVSQSWMVMVLLFALSAPICYSQLATALLSSKFGCFSCGFPSWCAKKKKKATF